MSDIDKINDKITENLNEFKRNPYKFAAEMLAPHEDDPNELYYWFPETRKTGFRVPQTVCIPLDVELWYDAWAASLDGKIADPVWSAVTKKVYEELPESWRNKELFFRTGGSSGKFSFRNSCRVSDMTSLSMAIASTFYENECCGKPVSRWLVFREFICTANDRPTIYNGLKLNTEARIFWDADEKKVLGSFDYWYQEKDEIVKVLKYHPEELDAYLKTEPIVRKEFEALSPELIADCTKKLPAMDLKGQWSVDFMWTGSEWVLIDMAVARQSAFFKYLTCTDF